MITLISKDKIKKWITNLEQMNVLDEHTYLAISRRLYKSLDELVKQAEYEDLDLQLVFASMKYLKKGKIKGMLEKYGDVNVAIDNSTIETAEDLRLDESYYFYIMTTRK